MTLKYIRKIAFEMYSQIGEMSSICFFKIHFNCIRKITFNMHLQNWLQNWFQEVFSKDTSIWFNEISSKMNAVTSKCDYKIALKICLQITRQVFLKMWCFEKVISQFSLEIRSWRIISRCITKIDFPKMYSKNISP